jgi:hypothetical protein
LISFSKPSKALHVIFNDLLLLHTLNNKPCPWQHIFQFIMKLNDFKMHIWLFFASLLNIVWDWSQVLIREWLLFYSFRHPRTLMAMSFVGIFLIGFSWCIYLNLSMKNWEFDRWACELRMWCWWISWEPITKKKTQKTKSDTYIHTYIHTYICVCVWVTSPLDVVNSNHSLRKNLCINQWGSVFHFNFKSKLEKKL